MKTAKKNPEKRDSLATVSNRGSDSAEALPRRVERYSKAKLRALQMVAYLSEQSTDRSDIVSANQERCGAWLEFSHYHTVDTVRLTKATFCKQHLTCPLCAIRRGSKQLTAYLEKYEELIKRSPGLTAYLVTFTVKNGDDLEERQKHLADSLRKLHSKRRNSKSSGRCVTEAAKASAAVWSFELTNRGNGWHPHVHAIWLCSEMPDQQKLSGEWNRITGDSFIVDVRLISQSDPASGFIEVFKYALKFSDLTLEQNWFAAETFRKSRSRLLGSFGAFRGIEIPETMTDEPLDELPHTDLFYRYLGDQYSLERVTKHD